MFFFRVQFPKGNQIRIILRIASFLFILKVKDFLIFFLTIIFIDVSSVHATNTRQKLLGDIKLAVKQALAATLTGTKTILDDEDTASNVLCNSLEASISFGLRGSFSLSTSHLLFLCLFSFCLL